ncbi:MAG TPA: hypothetical protein VHL12_01755 [Gemmatimonadaceae bacterium]|nr:hypothetical protein [Gemmatimonadaceae bacterium]
MTKDIKGALVVVTATLLASCTSSRQSTADTTATASSTVPAVIPAVGAAVGDSLHNAASGQSGAHQGAVTPISSTTDVRAAATSSGTSRSSASDSGIIGRDSVVRRRVRGLPTATSTPIRR